MLLVGCASTPAPGPTPRETAPEPTLVEIVRDRQDIAVSHTDTRLAIDNPHGNVYLRQSAEPYIGVFSTEQRLGRTPEAARLLIDHTDAQVKVTVSYDSDAVIGVNTPVNGQLKGRVDLVVFVPEWIQCAVSTTYGDISVKRVQNSIRASAASGSISVTTRGQMSLQTEQGDIHGSTMDAHWTGDSEVRTTSGNIVFGVPTYGNVKVIARSSGSITADFETIRSTEQGRHAVQHISGSGRTQLLLESTTGEIILDGFDRDQVELAQPGEMK